MIDIQYQYNNIIIIQLLMILFIISACKNIQGIDLSTLCN